jgi:hypothetical protein
MSLDSMQNSIKPIIATISSFLSTNTPNYLKNGEAQTLALKQLGKLSKLVSENTPDSIKKNETVAYVLSNLEDLSAVVSRNTPKIIKENPGISVLLSLTALGTLYLQINSCMKTRPEIRLKLERSELKKFTAAATHPLQEANSIAKKMRYVSMCLKGLGGKIDLIEAEAVLSNIPKPLGKNLREQLDNLKAAQ